MQSARTLAARLLVAVGLFVVFVSSASGVTAYDITTGANLLVGSGSYGTSTGNIVLRGTFFGITNIVYTCTASTLSGSVLANPSSSGNAVSSIDGLSFTGCVSTSKPSGCAVLSAGLPWRSSNEGGFVADTLTSAHVGTGASGSIDLTDCAGVPCTVKGGAATTSWGSDSLVNYVNGSVSGGNTLTISGAVLSGAAPASCLTRGLTVTATYDLTNPVNGDPVGLR